MPTICDAAQIRSPLDLADQCGDVVLVVDGPAAFEQDGLGGALDELVRRADGLGGVESDRAGLSARQIADHLGHSRPSITQNYYRGRRAVTSDAARALDRAHRDAVDDSVGGVSGALERTRSCSGSGCKPLTCRKLLRLDSNQ